MAKVKDEHVVVRDGGGFECLHCGRKQDMAMPIDLDVYLAAAKVFTRKHRHCKKAETKGE